MTKKKRASQSACPFQVPTAQRESPCCRDNVKESAVVARGGVHCLRYDGGSTFCVNPPSEPPPWRHRIGATPIDSVSTSVPLHILLAPRREALPALPCRAEEVAIVQGRVAFRGVGLSRAAVAYPLYSRACVHTAPETYYPTYVLCRGISRRTTHGRAMAEVRLHSVHL